MWKDVGERCHGPFEERRGGRRDIKGLLFHGNHVDMNT
jgi:hypothetical protein